MLKLTVTIGAGYDREDRPIPAYAVQRLIGDSILFIVEQTGAAGVTVTQGHGYWISPTGPVSEPVVIFTTILPNDPDWALGERGTRILDHSKFGPLSAKLRDLWNQTCVSVDVTTVDWELI